MNYNELFEPSISFPDPDYMNRYNELVGLDVVKETLEKLLGIILNPGSLEEWVEKYHPEAQKVVTRSIRKAPLVVFEGDVGSGKTELATTIGDAIARTQKVSVELYPLSLSARGEGRVGQMTKLISDAFQYVADSGKKLKGDYKNNGGIILLLDEADAIAQSREFSQMHHEDKAGVNALIRGIDRLSSDGLPVAIILCTNRLGSLDPAVKRRASRIFSFRRPGLEQRINALDKYLKPLGLKKNCIKQIAELTGSIDDRNYGFSYSDLLQRLLPSIIIDAFPNSSVNCKRALSVTKSIIPTPPFKEHE